MGGSLLMRQRDGIEGFGMTAVGFGAWAVGGHGWIVSPGRQDDDRSVAAIRHAVELGVNWIDTAAVYGAGHSEEVVGRALKAIPASERPMVFTKGGRFAKREKPADPPWSDLRPQTIRKEIEGSLRRLGLERIDLYQLHWPEHPEVTPLEESWGEMARLVEEGKARAVGVSNFTVELLERIERIRHVDSLQPPFSLIRRGAAADVIPWAAAHGTGVIVYSPMQAGILTESFGSERITKMDEDDWRRHDPEFNEPNLGRNLALRDGLEPIARRRGVSVSAVAIGWTLSWPGVSGAIVGARSPEQVDGWIAGGSLEVTEQDLDEIAAVLERTGAGTGPTRPPQAS